MGWKWSKPDQVVGTAVDMSTVGVTILPGHPLPPWVSDGQPHPADVAAEIAMEVESEAAADAPGPDGVFEPGAPVEADEVAEHLAPWSADPPGGADEPSAAAAYAALSQLLGHPDAGSEDRSPAADPVDVPVPAAMSFLTAGVGTLAAQGYGASGAGDDSSAAYPGGGVITEAPATAPGIPAARTTPERDDTLAPPAPTTPAMAVDTAPGPAPTASPLSGPPATSVGDLSPEHIALLTWWAEMIAKGEVPGLADPTSEPSSGDAGSRVPGDLDPGPADPDPQADVADRHGRAPKLVALGVGGVALAGLAVGVGPNLIDSLGSEEPVASAPAVITMPTAISDLTSVTDDGVGDQLQSMLGLGARPTGVTATGGYGTAADGPVAMAVLASTSPPSGTSSEQLDAWAQRMAATVGEPVAAPDGTSTCASVTGIADAPNGAICVWSGTGLHGQAYVVGASPEAALERASQVRDTLAVGGTPPPQE